MDLKDSFNLAVNILYRYKDRMKKILGIIHLSYAVLITGLYFFIIFFPLVFVSSLIKDKKKRLRTITPLWNGFGKVIMNLSCFCKIDFVDQREKPQKYPQGLYIANHQSMMDIPLVLCYYIIPPIFKKEILKIPFFGLACKISTAIPVDRKDKNSRQNVIKECQRRLLDGQAVQYYPEGTRSRDGKPKNLKDIKLRLVDFAYDNNIPVTSFTIIGTPSILNKYGFIRPFTTVHFIISKEFLPKDFQSKEDFTQATWNKISDNFEKYSTL